MSKYLRIDTNEMNYLKRRAMLDMVFESPNAVLRDILRLPSKKTLKPSAKSKIRVDDQVLEQLDAKAKELNMNIRPIDKLLEAVRKVQNELEDQDEDPSRHRRLGGRPATR